ncbi:calu [Bugula neritina]|uniref:Reticulocalbin-3 n=1 Tax=Bugula neritina TaxID=10212 RepID=A0A7J7JN67_BUGNE|nr:calu [Bugula neritina]
MVTLTVTDVQKEKMVAIKMPHFQIVLLSLLLNGVLSSIIPENHDRRSQVKDLSDLEHQLKGGHNAEYDHEAFLGKEKAHEFDRLTPEQSKQRLGVLVDKIDSNNDGLVTEPEMVAWIKYIQRRYVTEDAKTQWANYELEGAASMSWDYYMERTYGSATDETEMNSETKLHFKEMKDRDYRRFKLADVDYDGKLTFTEYVNFLHPEDAPHMREVVVKETLDDLDKNKDGRISIDEYIVDMWPDMGKETEPEWVTTEREHFEKWRDLNKDGFLDSNEIQHWVMPDDYDHAIAESRHLIYEADSSKDGNLTKREILDHSDLFVGSQATDFGEAFKYSHDEF